jgi:segregation and condensation protein B
VAAEELRAIEAILMVTDQPVDPHMLSQLLEVPPLRVDEICQELAESYASDDRGFVLVKVAGGYRFQSHPDLAPYVERFVLEGQSARLSAAALETLAIVAYKQPVSRAQVASIRGVSSDAVMRTLQTRGLIAEVARDPGPGQASLYGTTSLLLERLGLNSIDELPNLAGFVPGPEIMDSLERSLRADRSAPATGDPGTGHPGTGHPGTGHPGTGDPATDEQAADDNAAADDTAAADDIAAAGHDDGPVRDGSDAFDRRPPADGPSADPGDRLDGPR